MINNVEFIPKSKMKSMRVVSWFLGKRFMTNFWTTIRFPFSKKTIIAYPDSVENPHELRYISTIEHELIHARDMSTGWGLFKTFMFYFFIPLPIFFSGRWFVERKAYLHNIINHGYNIDRVVETLWNGYVFPWPKSLMKKWFITNKEKAE